MQHLPITGSISWWLHLLPLLATLFVAVLLIRKGALANWSAAMRERRITWSAQARGWIAMKLGSRFWSRTGRGTAKWWPIVFAAAISALLVYAAIAADRPPNYVLMHGVRVLERLDRQSFRAEVKDVATGEWYQFVVKSCPEFEPTHEIQGGVTLTMLQYVEDRSRSCVELDGKYAGYVLQRDREGNPTTFERRD